MSESFVSEDFLDELIFLSLQNKELFLVIQTHLKDNFIEDDQYLEIWKEVKRQYKINEVMPTTSQLKQHFRSNEGIIDYLEKIKEVKLEGRENTMTIFEEYIRQKKFIQFHEKSAEEYNKGNKQKAYQTISEGTKDLMEFSLKTAEFIRVFEGFNERHLDRVFGVYGGRQVIPTGIDCVDEHTEGGPITGETLMYMGDSGSGKSTLLVHHGVIAAKNGFDVLHVQAEGTKQQCLNMYDACWTGSTYRELRNGGMTDSKYKAYRTVIQKIQGEVFVQATEKFGTVSMLDVYNWAYALKRKSKKFKLLNLDYLTLCDTADNVTYGANNERLRFNKLAREFKNICVELDVLGITVAQSNTINPELLNDPDFHMTRFNIGEGKRMIEPFSYFITINQTKDEYDESLARLYFDKLREHKSGQLVMIAQNLARKRFYDRKRSMELMS